MESSSWSLSFLKVAFSVENKAIGITTYISANESTLRSFTISFCRTPIRINFLKLTESMMVSDILNGILNSTKAQHVALRFLSSA